MPETSISAHDGLLKDFFIILLGSALGAFLVWIWNATLGAWIDRASGGKV